MRAMRSVISGAAMTIILLTLPACSGRNPVDSLCPRDLVCSPQAPPPPGPSPVPTPGENYTVTARPLTSGAVRITSDPARIDCLNNDSAQGDRCVETFPANTTVRLTATAQTGHNLVRWQGGPCTGLTTTLCTITGLSAPVTVQAVSDPVAPPPSNRIVWTGAVSNVWSMPANWDLGRVPLAADEVFIGGAGSVNLQATSTPVEVDRVVLNGALFVSAGATLRVAKDLDGTGSLGVQSDGSGEGRLEFGVSSVVRQLTSTGRISGPPGGTGGFDEMPTFRVEQATFSTAAGAQAPTLVDLQLEASQSVSIDGHLPGGSRTTLRVLNGAQLTWSGNVLGGVTMGSGGQFIGSCRLQNLGTVTVQVGWGVNCRLENDGVITLAGGAAFTARGVNRGTIRSLASLGSPSLLTFSGNSGAAPHWVFEPTSIITENIQRVTINAGSVIQGRLTARSIQLGNVSGTNRVRHEVHTAQVTADSLTASADSVDLRFTGAFDLTQLILSGVLKVQDGSTVRTGRSTFTGGTLLGGVLESGNVVFSGTFTLAGRLAVTGSASAAHATVVGRGGTFELRGGTLDLNPGSSNAIDIRPAGTGAGADLRVINEGVILKRGGGTARIEACFSGSGSVVNDAGAQAVTIVSLSC